MFNDQLGRVDSGELFGGGAVVADGLERTGDAQEHGRAQHCFVGWLVGGWVVGGGRKRGEGDFKSDGV